MRDYPAEATDAPAPWRTLARLAPWLWPYGALAAILGLVLWPAWLRHELLVIGGDTLVIHYPWFVLWRDALAAGELPFWNPYTFGGLPAFATLQAGYGYPPHWALTWLPAMQAVNWTVGLHVLLAGLGAAWCAGRLGASGQGQFLSGAAYALGSAMVARMSAGHLSFLEANAWLPLATGLAIQAGRPQAVVYLALVVGLLALAGQPELLIMSLWWLPLWAGLAATSAGWSAVVRAALRTGLGVGLGIGLAAFQLSPVLEVLRISNRQAGMDWDFQTGASLPPWHLLEVFAPLVFGSPHEIYWPGPAYEWHERLLYVGVVPLIAAGFASGRWRWICLGGAALAVALAFGHYAPWYAWTQVLPGYSSFRIPSKHLTLAALALALAAGLGLERLHGRRVALVSLAAALLLGVNSLAIAAWLPTNARLLADSEPLAAPNVRESTGAWAADALRLPMAILALLALLALLPAVWARRGILVLALLDLVLVLHPYRTEPGDPQFILDQAVLLRDHERAAVVGNLGAVLGDYGPVLKVTQPVGYVSLFSSEYMQLVAGAANASVAVDLAPDDVPYLYLLGYGVVIDREKPLVTIADPPPPQAWVARCVWPGRALRVRQPDFPRGECITRATATQREPVVPPGPARVVAERAGWLLVEAAGPGWLVTTQPWYPGWSARVDGALAAVEAVDGALVGVRLPAGVHTIALSYRPAGLERGIVISLAVALLLLASWWLDHRSGARDRARSAARQVGRPGGLA